MILDNDLCKPTKVVALSNVFYKAVEGKYYVGQTEIVSSDGLNIWGALYNPPESGVNIFVNVLTVTNLSNSSFLAEIWLNTDFPGKGIRSGKFTSTNTIPFLETTPRGKIIYSNDGVCNHPEGGVNIYDRMIPVDSTIVTEEDSKFIIPPGGCYGAFVKAKTNQHLRAIFAFGWSEESIKSRKI